ncbi:hypothetical protein [Polynucleobacter asymbioticus]|uniref:hypothetical protein n=1 Tax=Polynucleobacter asymbioticus TaxID=576611 RepID=UPI001F46D91D|nr:hypothetical protein [Polynucleobacter asymbioticus]
MLLLAFALPAADLSLNPTDLVFWIKTFLRFWLDWACADEARPRLRLSSAHPSAMSSLVVSGDLLVAFLFTPQLSNIASMHTEIHAVTQQISDPLYLVQP